MNILQICNKPPFPLVDGGTMAMYNLSEALFLQGHQVKIIALNTSKHFFDPSKLPSDFVKKYSPEYLFINTEITFFNTLANLFSKESFHASRFYSSEISSKIIECINSNSFDCIILDSLFSGVYFDDIKKVFKGKIILREHNVEHLLWKRILDEEKSILKKAYLKIQIGRLVNYELSLIKKVDAIISITQSDKKSLEHWFPSNRIMVFPYTVNTLPAAPKEHTLKHLFFHLGSMDWKPNIEGMDWFITNVWEAYFKNNANYTLSIAGRNMPKDFFEFENENTKIKGEISNAMEFVEQGDAMICPLFSGGGMRIKIIEALMHGKPVVSTSIGAEGIPYQLYLPSPILIADTAIEFSEKMKELFADNLYWQRSQNAIKLIEENYLLASNAKKLSDFITFENTNNSH